MASALYAAYFTGVGGQSIGLFYIGGGVIAGVDVGTMRYDGSYSKNSDGSLDGVIEYTIPSGISVITGAPAGAMPTKVAVNLKLPVGFDDGRVISIETPIGPVNAKFEKLKDLP